jgi:hypothetical protein
MFENLTVKLSSLCNSCAKIACSSSELVFTFRYAGSTIHNASEQFVRCTRLSFYTLRCSSNPTPKYNGVTSVDSDNSLSRYPITDTCSYKLLFPSVTDSVASHNIDLSSWITLYYRTVSVSVLNCFRLGDWTFSWMPHIKIPFNFNSVPQFLFTASVCLTCSVEGSPPA